MKYTEICEQKIGDAGLKSVGRNRRCRTVAPGQSKRRNGLPTQCQNNPDAETRERRRGSGVCWYAATSTRTYGYVGPRGTDGKTKRKGRRREMYRSIENGDAPGICMQNHSSTSRVKRLKNGLGTCLAWSPASGKGSRKEGRQE